MIMQTKAQVTRLHEFHISKGGRMVDFVGWNMPLHYADLSHTQSHLYTRFIVR